MQNVSFATFANGVRDVVGLAGVAAAGAGAWQVSEAAGLITVGVMLYAFAIIAQLVRR